MASPSSDPRIKPKPAKPPVPVVADAPVEMPPPPAYPKELLSDAAFWSVFREWFPVNGGLPEELRVLERLAAGKRVSPAQLVFRTLRKAIARGEWD